MALEEWVCTNCGTAGAHPLSYLQFDVRYQTGYCDNCNDPHPKNPRKTPRPTQRLVLASAFDREAWETAREKAELIDLVKMRTSAGLQPDGKGGTRVMMKDTDIARLVVLFDKHGAPGFHLSQDDRDAVSKIVEEQKRREEWQAKAHSKGRRR